MLNQQKIVQILRKELPYLENTYKVKKVGLFGSFAKGKEKIDSDIDIVIEFKSPIGLTFVELAEYIEKLLGRKVDVITSEGIKSIRVREVAEDIKRSVRYV